MEIRHLKYFLTLADELHFGNAAKKLFISQPPLSRMIKMLEDELGVRLFERNNKNVRLTSYGKYLQKEAQQIIHSTHRITNHLDAMKNGSKGQIKVGYIPAIMHSVLPQILSKLKDKHTAISTYLSELESKDQINALKSGEIDIGFLRIPSDDKELEFEHILDDPFVLIVSEKHPLAVLENIDLKQLDNEPMISFLKSCPPTRGIKNIFKKAGHVPNIVQETNQINSILRVVECNCAYSIVPSTVLVGYDLKVKSFELSHFDETTPLYMGYNLNNLTKSVEDLIKIVKEFKTQFLLNPEKCCR